MTIDPERLGELTAELGFMPATPDVARHRPAPVHTRTRTTGWPVVIALITCAGSTTGARGCKWAVPGFWGAGAFGVSSRADTGDTAANTTAAAYGWPPGNPRGRARTSVGLLERIAGDMARMGCWR